MRSAKELDAYAAQVEQLVRRARQQQAAGEWDGAARDLRKSVEVVGEWQEALMNGRRSEKSAPPLSLPAAPVPLGVHLRIAGNTSSPGIAERPIVGTSSPEVAERPIVGPSSSRSAECRLADLESKVDRILHALEKDGHDRTERPKSASPNQ
jgi:hypothetical protein